MFSSMTECVTRQNQEEVRDSIAKAMKAGTATPAAATALNQAAKSARKTMEAAATTAAAMGARCSQLIS